MDCANIIPVTSGYNFDDSEGYIESDTCSQPSSTTLYKPDYMEQSGQDQAEAQHRPLHHCTVVTWSKLTVHWDPVVHSSEQ